MWQVTKADTIIFVKATNESTVYGSGAGTGSGDGADSLNFTGTFSSSTVQGNAGNDTFDFLAEIGVLCSGWFRS